MKQKLLYTLLLLIGIAQRTMAQEEAYAVLSDDEKTVTFYYDNQRNERHGVVDIREGEGRDFENIHTAVFSPSFVHYRSTKTAYWFDGCWALSSIIGLKNFNTANVTDMTGMFRRCSSLTNINWSDLNTTNVKSMREIFPDFAEASPLAPLHII